MYPLRSLPTTTTQYPGAQPAVVPGAVPGALPAGAPYPYMPGLPLPQHQHQHHQSTSSMSDRSQQQQASSSNNNNNSNSKQQASSRYHQPMFDKVPIEAQLENRIDHRLQPKAIPLVVVPRIHHDPRRVLLVENLHLIGSRTV